MGRSLYPVARAKVIENFDDTASTVVHEKTKLKYRAFIDEKGQWWQEEFLEDGTYSRRVEAEYVIGSGNHTRSYLGWVEGELVQLPMTWYTQRKIWDMSPGYQDNNFRFTRPISPKCLFCHNDFTPAREHTLAGYTTRLSEGISCNRCHGDGTHHVNNRLAGKPFVRGAPDEILNPKDLDQDGQSKLCGQCHLQGVARVLKNDRAWDRYDPRTPLEDHMTIFVPKNDRGSEFGIASHGHRLALSACASKGGATCSSCHNPHKDDRAIAGQQACIQCHSDGGKLCSQPNIGEQSCASCHMNLGETSDIPHVYFSDHYIRIPPFDAVDETDTKDGELEVAYPQDQDPLHTLTVQALAHYETWKQAADDFGEYHRETAENELRDLLAQGVQSFRVYEALAQILKATDRPTEAIIEFQKALQLEQPDFRFLVDMALAQQAARQLDDAEATLLKALELRPDGRVAWVNLGSVLAEGGHFEKADEAYARADQIAPHLPIIAINRARNARNRGRPIEARRWFQKCLERDPRSLICALELAVFDYDARQYRSARASIQRILDIEPDYAAAYWLLARIDIRERDIQAAQTALERFQSLKPDAPEPYLELASMHANMGNLDKAIEVLNHGKTMVTEDPRFNQFLRYLNSRPRTPSIPDPGFSVQ